MEWRYSIPWIASWIALLRLCVVAIEKGAFGLPFGSSILLTFYESIRYEYLKSPDRMQKIKQTHAHTRRTKNSKETTTQKKQIWMYNEWYSLTSRYKITHDGLTIFTQPLRSGRIWHEVNFKRTLTGLNSEFSFF